MTDRPLDPLTSHAANHPDKLAIIDDRPDGFVEAVTFGELNRRVNRLANALLAAGVEAGNSVMWCGKNSIRTLELTHAARKLGTTAVALNYRLSPEEAAYVTHNSDAVFVWTDAEFVELFTAIRGRTPNVRQIVAYGSEGSDLPEGVDVAETFLAGASDQEPPRPDVAPRTMIYTSGTTGKPKGSVRTGVGDPEQIAALTTQLRLRPDDIYLTTGPLYHSGPSGFATRCFLLGCTVVVQHKFDTEDWFRLVEKYKVTATFSAPTPVRLLCNLPAETKARYDVSSIRVTIANAAPWSFALKKAYLADFPENSLFEVYGSTELGVNTLLEPEDQLRKPGSCGKPAAGVEIKLLRDDGTEVTEPHEPGEIYIRSKSVFDEYHKARDKYDEDRRGDFHTVGDVAYFDDEGYYYVCDRKKDMIISGGMNIYPAEIEATLDGHPEIYEAAVFGIPSEEWGESVHATVVRQAGSSLDASGVEAYSREHLASYKIPRSIAFAEELPKTGSGKVLKRQLREPFWQGHERNV